MTDKGATNRSGRWEIIGLLCRLAGGWLRPPHPVALTSQRNWELIIEAASYHLVTPALSYSLKGRSGVPQAINDYLGAVLFLSGERNQDLLGGLAQPLRALNGAGIEPILLKGIASIASALYPDPAMRILSDIDLLVPESEAENASRLLAALGFRQAFANELIDYGEHHHRVPQRHPDTGVVIELHVRPVLSEWDSLLNTQSVTEQASSIWLEGCSVLVPSPTHRVIHNIIHNQLSDLNYACHRIDVRQMLELAALIQRHADEIDWPAIRRAFGSNGQAPMLEDTLEIVGSLFGVSTGVITRSPRNPLLALQREVEKSDLSWLFKRYARAIKARPATLLRGFQSRSWSKMLKAIRRDFRAQRW